MVNPSIKYCYGHAILHEIFIGFFFYPLIVQFVSKKAYRKIYLATSQTNKVIPFLMHKFH